MLAFMVILQDVVDLKRDGGQLAVAVQDSLQMMLARRRIGCSQQTAVI